MRAPYIIQSALEVYCKTSKRVPAGNTYGLLRKARRLDSVLEPFPIGQTWRGRSNQNTVEEAAPEPKCHQCHTQYSPFFWPDDLGVLCHQCKMSRDSESATDDDDPSDAELSSNSNLNGDVTPPELPPALPSETQVVADYESSEDVRYLKSALEPQPLLDAPEFSKTQVL
jgi:hypothetical protein